MQGKQYMPNNIKWAQRKNAVFLTVEIRDLKNEKIVLTESSLTFDGESDDKHYHFALQFYAEIDKEESKWTKTGFSIKFNLVKKDQQASYWPRLLKDTKKHQYIVADWDKYIDEDDEEQEGKKGMQDWDPSAMQGMPGMGGMGGMGGFPGMGGMGGFPGGMGGFPGMDMEGDEQQGGDQQENDHEGEQRQEENAVKNSESSTTQ